jgi:hypothetical protein
LAVEFVHGDAGHPDVIERAGVMDVVFFAGIPNHHPALSICWLPCVECAAKH